VKNTGIEIFEVEEVGWDEKGVSSYLERITIVKMVSVNGIIQKERH